MSPRIDKRSSDDGNGDLGATEKERLRQELEATRDELKASLEKARRNSELAAQMIDETRSQAAEFDAFKVRLDRTLDVSEKKTEDATRVLRRSRLLS
jgi:hypothetical protein